MDYGDASNSYYICLAIRMMRLDTYNVLQLQNHEFTIELTDLSVKFLMTFSVSLVQIQFDAGRTLMLYKGSDYVFVIIDSESIS